MTDNAFIDAVRKGNCYCAGCGEPKIHKSESWKPWCSNCFAQRKTRKFCRYCANYIQQNRIDFAKKKGGECIQCYACDNNLTNPHPVHGVKLPDRFFLSLR